MEGDIDVTKTDQITSIEFSNENTHFYLGSVKGKVFKYELPSPQEVEKYKLEKQKEKKQKDQANNKTEIVDESSIGRKFSKKKEKNM